MLRRRPASAIAEHRHRSIEQPNLLAPERRAAHPLRSIPIIFSLYEDAPSDFGTLDALFEPCSGALHQNVALGIPRRRYFFLAIVVWGENETGTAVTCERRYRPGAAIPRQRSAPEKTPCWNLPATASMWATGAPTFCGLFFAGGGNEWLKRRLFDAFCRKKRQGRSCHVQRVVDL